VIVVLWKTLSPRYVDLPTDQDHFIKKLIASGYWRFYNITVIIHNDWRGRYGRRGRDKGKLEPLGLSQ